MRLQDVQAGDKLVLTTIPPSVVTVKKTTKTSITVTLPNGETQRFTLYGEPWGTSRNCWSSPPILREFRPGETEDSIAKVRQRANLEQEVRRRTKGLSETRLKDIPEEKLQSLIAAINSVIQHKPQAEVK